VLSDRLTLLYQTVSVLTDRLTLLYQTVSVLTDRLTLLYQTVSVLTDRLTLLKHGRTVEQLVYGSVVLQLVTLCGLVMELQVCLC
jgi:hypothetical protein